MTFQGLQESTAAASSKMSRSSRRLKKLSCEDAEEGKQSTKNTKGFSGTPARQDSLEERAFRSELSTATDDVDFMRKFALLADRLSKQDRLAQSRPTTPSDRSSTPSESQADPSSDEESQADPSSDEEEEFSFPKKTAKPTARTSTSPVDLRNSFAALTDNEEEQETTPALLEPTFKDRLPPIFIKITPSQEHLDIIKSLIYPETRIQIQGPCLKIVTKDQTEYSRLLTRTNEEQWQYYTYSPMVNDRTKFDLKGLPNSTDCDTIKTAFHDLNIHVNHVRQMTKSCIENGQTRQNPIT